MREITIRKILLISFLGEFLLLGILALIFDSDTNLNVLMLISLIATMLMVLKSGKVNKALMVERLDDFKSKFNFKEIILVVITQILISLALSFIISSVIYSIDPNSAIEMMSEEIFETNSYLDLFLGVIMGSLLAPIFEEIVFRRVIFTRLSKRLGIILGAIISSLVFGLLHIELAVIGAMIFGVACCILYRKYNNILIPISMHMINNIIAAILSIISFVIEGPDPVIDYTMTANDIRSSLIVGCVLLIIACIMFGIFIYKNKIYFKREKFTPLSV